MSNSDDLRKSAEAGSVVSQSVLGMLLLLGEDGIDQNLPEAFRWLSAAAARGVPRASVWLGRMYEDGLATPPDLKRARELYRFGAERREFHGCVFLARTYVAPPGDETEAFRWYAAALEIFPEGLDDDPEFAEARAYISSR